MQAMEQKRSCIRLGETGWISVQIENSANDSAEPARAGEASSNVPNIHLFEHLASETPFPERFPRLTCFAIACGLLASAVLAEVELLKGAGYHWQ